MRSFIDIQKKRVADLKETLTNLSVKNHRKIQLIANQNRLKTLDGVEMICQEAQQLKFHNNMIQQVDAMQNLEFPILQRLYLQYNCIKSIKGLVSSKFPILQRLSLGANLIQDVQLLESLQAPNLLVLNLDSNKLKNVDFLANLPTPHLLYIDLRQNLIEDISCLQKSIIAQTIQKLSLQNNVMTKFTQMHVNFRNLNKLDLRKNRIQSLQQLTSCFFPKLQVIHLQENLLTNCRFLAKLTAPNMLEIHLDKNKLQQVDDLRETDLGKLQQISVGKNRIFCNFYRQLIISFGGNKSLLSIKFSDNRIIIKQRQKVYRRLKIYFPNLSYCQF